VGWLRGIGGARARRQALRERAARIYLEAVQRARDPGLYTAFTWPDTIDGRFEMVALHVLLYGRRLQRAGGDGPALAQAVVDAFFADLDRNLREMGVGDLSMGRKMKQIAATWMARARDLGAALDAGDVAGIAAVLRRNLGGAGTSTDFEGLARAALALEAQLARRPLPDFPAAAPGSAG
jgi:cytochrome b pre-mRNA-processing protein 3